MKKSYYLMIVCLNVKVKNQINWNIFNAFVVIAILSLFENFNLKMLINFDNFINFMVESDSLLGLINYNNNLKNKFRKNWFLKILRIYHFFIN